MNARKREERLSEDRQQLEKLINIKKCYERGEMKEYQKGMRQNLLSNREELEVLIRPEIILFIFCSACLMMNFFLFFFIENNSKRTRSC